MKKFLLLFILCLFSYLHPRGTIILLTGTSSSGKTGIALELQKICGDSCVYLNVDEEFLNPLMHLMVKYLQQKTSERVTNENAEDISNKLILDKVVTQEEVGSFRGKLEKSLYNKMIQKIRNLIRKEKSVIFDVVTTEKQEIMNWFEEFRGSNVLFVLVYCSFQELSKRVAARNIIGDQEKRSFSMVWEQFGELYKAAEKGERPLLENLSRKTVEHLVKSCTKNEFDDVKELNKFLSTLLNRLGLNIYNSVKITPRYTYDFIVDTGRNDSHTCAQQIDEFMKQKNRYIALEKNYNEFKKTGWQKMWEISKNIWTKFWDFVFCRK